MKAKLKCKIDDVIRGKELTTLSVSSFDGKVDTKMPPAQFVTFGGQLEIKPVIADQLKIGSIILIDITVEEAEDDGPRKSN